MRVEVVNTGTELLLGKVDNTHAGYLGRELFKLGLRIARQTTIPDGDDIRAVLGEAFPRTDVILITGGLGPTSDDLTREVVADLVGRPLHFDESVMETIDELFRARGLPPNTANQRQAMVPEGADVLANENGTAPGLHIPADPSRDVPHLFLLPGPPRELKPMFEEQVHPLLASMRREEQAGIEWRNFRIFGVGESTLATELEPRFDSIPDLEVGYCARLGEVDVRLIGPPSSIEAGAALVREAYAEEIVTESEDSIAEVVVALLAERGETVATAESCTGGYIVGAITDVSGSSRALERGYVTYANEAKTEVLGVPAPLLEEHGAVSDPVASAMAEGCLRISGADHALAVSGIAGPTGGSEEKPVGTVHLALASRGQPTFVRRYFYPVDRLSFKLRVTRLALDRLRRRLRGFALD